MQILACIRYLFSIFIGFVLITLFTIEKMIAFIFQEYLYFDINCTQSIQTAIIYILDNRVCFNLLFIYGSLKSYIYVPF